MSEQIKAKQRAIIQEQNAVLKESEIDLGMVAVRLEHRMADLKRAADQEMREINARAIRRVQELGAEYKQLSLNADAEVYDSPA